MAHYLVHDINGRLRLRNRLLAFHVVEGKHNGVNLGRTIFEILKEAHLLGQVSGYISFIPSDRLNPSTQLSEFTFDNASNCDTTMETLEALLTEAGIPFCRHRNRIKFVALCISKVLS
jgi:hypothetical protein